jgi:protein-tyrosine phosphatase
MWFIAVALCLCTIAQFAAAFSDQDLQVEHDGQSHFVLRWTQPGPVDVFVSARPDAKVSTMRLLDRQDQTHQFETSLLDIKRPYFVLRGENGDIYRAAERLLPLEGGSNFRDLGGYLGADGKRVRWGLLFRSAAMSKLTDADYAYLSTLRIKSILDLRSSDERQLSPTAWRASRPVQSIAVDYPGEVIFNRLQGYDGPRREWVTERLYEQLPMLLIEDYKKMFQALLARKTPLVIFGSAGQDRTGIGAALILSALGTPRDVIYRDYLLSVEDRRPANEMIDVDLQQYARTNSEARFLLAYRAYTETAHAANASPPKTLPLKDLRGRPLLQDALEQIEADYGSVSHYLDQVLDVHAEDIAILRTLYLE